jgi:superfamily II DNA helicase RecQ
MDDEAHALDTVCTGDLLSLEVMYMAVKDHFGFFPCRGQLEAALTKLGQHDLVTLAPTGLGKTLTFWIPLLFNAGGIMILVTLLVV